ncbi:hypothetical protein [Methylovulum miyakonense]|uniref:hypothetical protein n=1 Tax=Methylovulum miyakonense TaxID=645578 RepID=UPI000364B61F|nr:hypothetical protein [Methylovulum miyakonense]
MATTTYHLYEPALTDVQEPETTYCKYCGAEILAGRFYCDTQCRNHHETELINLGLLSPGTHINHNHKRPNLSR